MLNSVLWLVNQSYILTLFDSIITECTIIFQSNYLIYTAATGECFIYQENTPMNHSKPEFTYRTGSEIDTYPYWGKHGFYSGGGYVVEMSGSLKKVVEKVDELMEDEWVDKYVHWVKGGVGVMQSTTM